jgi:hypothetical protein
VVIPAFAKKIGPNEIQRVEVERSWNVFFAPEDSARRKRHINTEGRL